MGKTIKELAEKLSVSKQTIQIIIINYPLLNNKETAVDISL